jgi:hypothetical protein
MTAQTVHRAKRRYAGSIRLSTGLLNIGDSHYVPGNRQHFMRSNKKTGCNDLDKRIGGKIGERSPLATHVADGHGCRVFH